MVRTFTMTLGVVLLLVGILGFLLVPGDGYLLGIFAVNGTHNIIHTLSGILGIAAAYGGWSRLFCQAFGVVYLLVAVLGFASVGGGTDHTMLLGLVHINQADNILHVLIAVPCLYFGFAPAPAMARA
jgi:hypothetical protein